MRPYLLNPEGVDFDIGNGALTVDVVLGVVSRVTPGWVTRMALESLTTLELHLVYDWARREELHAKGYSSAAERRPRPSCLVSAALASLLLEVSAGGSSDGDILARFRERLIELSRLRDASPPPPPPLPSSSAACLDADVPLVRTAPASAPASAPVPALGSDRVDYRVTLEFVLRLPPGSTPTPTSEAIDAAALAMAGPPYEIGDTGIVLVEAPALWEALEPLDRATRRRVHRALVDARVTTPEVLRAQALSSLRQVPGLGEGSIRALSRVGLLGTSPRRRRRRARGGR